VNQLEFNVDYVELAHRHIQLYPSHKESYFAALIIAGDSLQEISINWLRMVYMEMRLVDLGK
jgi:hypothetical protein